MTAVGNREKRIDARDKLTGKTRFLTDLAVSDMVYAYPVFSSVPFGNITDINCDKAKSVPGFLGFYTYEDIPGENQVGVIIRDQPLLAEKTVRFVGDVLGVVTAESHRDVRQAASLVEVTYDTLPPVFTVDESKNSSGPFVHNTNIACSHRVIKGHVSDGFARSDHIIEADFSTPAQEHYYLEPQGCIVIPGDGFLKIIGSLQCPYYIRKAVAIMSGYSMDNIVVEQAPTGGAFGGKEDVPSEVCARTALAAMILKRPVKMVYSRRDDIQLTSKRHPFRMHYKIGVSDSGEIRAAEVRLEENAGAYATLSGVVSYRASIQGLGPYIIPNVKMESVSYYTNLPPNGAFRGFGSPQAAFGHERIMDIIADQLKMDPVEFRLKNIIRQGDSTITGQKLTTSVGAEETVQRVKTAADWRVIRSERRRRPPFLTGVGIAVTHYGNCLGAAGWHLDGSGAKISIRENGRIDVAFGLVEMGQGALTAVAQMTADALGVHVARINVLPTCSNLLPDSGPSVASRNIVMTGRAIQDAAAKIRPDIRNSAAGLLNCEPESVELINDTAAEKQSGNSVPIDDVFHHMLENNIPMQSEGWWHVPPLEFDPESGTGEAYFTYSYATHLAKVRVDTVTGMIRVEKVWAAHDVGKAVNPAGIEGQVEGGIAQGVGWALTEDFRFDRGRAITSGLTTYLLPTAGDTPSVETIIVENPEPEGPWGAKGVGEPAIIPTAAAIANAVSHALGAPVNELPITPEKVLDLLKMKSYK